MTARKQIEIVISDNTVPAERCKYMMPEMEQAMIDDLLNLKSQWEALAYSNGYKNRSIEYTIQQAPESE